MFHVLAFIRCTTPRSTSESFKAKSHEEAGKGKANQYRRNGDVNWSTRADIELLAEVDEAHETLSEPACSFINV